MAAREADNQATVPPQGRPVLEAVRVGKTFQSGGLLSRRRTPAVKDVSFELRDGETYGLVGESGSGKSTTGRMLAGLTKPDAGEVRYEGRNLWTLAGEDRRSARRNIQFVFQDPYSSFNPKIRIGDALEEPLVIHRLGSRAERKEKTVRMLEAVGLRPDHLFRYPHELSGGQRQRLSLARALILEPKVLLCDEPVSALDVSIQSQILNMLKRLKRELGLTMLFITHDMGVVRYISDRIGVMYMGTLVEEAETDDLFREPLHPYTRALLAAVPDLSDDRQGARERIVLRGELAAQPAPGTGCPFYPRCPLAKDACRSQVPVLREVKPGHKAACHLIEETEMRA
jgi:oligopeptide transport system ATP-binding protein